MTLTDKLKIIDDKIKLNQAQYDLDREAANICTLSSGEIKKYEYFTGKDLGYKPGEVQKAKFEYSPLGKFVEKSLDDSDKKERLLKRSQNNESKNKEQLDEIEYQGERQLDSTNKHGKNS